MLQSLISGAWYDTMMRDLHLVDACIALKACEIGPLPRQPGACSARLRTRRALCISSVQLPSGLMSELCAEALRAGIAPERVKNLIRAIPPGACIA